MSVMMEYNNERYDGAFHHVLTNQCWNNYIIVFNYL